MRTLGKRSKMPLYRMLAQLRVIPQGCPRCVHRRVHVHVVEPEAVVAAAVHREAAAQPVGLFIDGPVDLGAQRQRQAVGRHHGAHHALLGDDATQLLDRLLRVLHGDQAHGVEARVALQVGMIRPVVVRLAGGHGVVEADDLAVAQPLGRVHHRPVDAHVLQELQPTIRTHLLAAVPQRRRLHRAAVVKMVDGREDDALLGGDVPVGLSPCARVSPGCPPGCGRRHRLCVY